MTDGRAQSPDITPADGDPGDETARRYRYQWTWAAITCCMLLDDTQDVAEVFCEHHEDILLKHIGGTFSGIQFKTRASNQELWKTSDPDVKKSFARFALLEARFPGRFEAFHFHTNHLLHSAGNGQDIAHVLREIGKARDCAGVTGPSRAFLRHTAREADCSDEVAFAALSKARCSHDLPKLDDALVRLVGTLTAIWPRASSCSYDGVARAAGSLVDECGRASSLAHADVLPAYVPTVANPDDVMLAARLNGKRIDKERLLRILDQGLDGTAPLDGTPSRLVEPGTGSLSLLRQKLDAGGFSAVSLNSAEELRDRADYLGMTWLQKHGRAAGLQMYNALRTQVLSDAARAFEDAKADERPFGVEMLRKLRSQLDRRRAEGAQLHNCTNEHLEGFAYSLTAECSVCWSLERPWEAE